MQCPQCSKEMKPGTVKMAMSSGGVAMAVFDAFLGMSGSPGEHLYFYPDDGRDTTRVVDRIDRQKKAMQCPGCQMVLIPGERTTPTYGDS